jgi:type II secretory pathway pseudopilin PulG
MLSRVAPKRRSAAPRRAGGGFTLLEVLTALGLSVLLATAIYGAVAIYLRVSAGDQGELERSRLVRALLRQMTLDLQSVVFRAEEQTESTSESSSESSSASSSSSSSTSGASGSTSGETQTIEIASVAETVQSTSLGLIGDAQKLTVHVSRPARGMNYQPVLSAGGANVRTSDLQSITYFLANPSAGGLEGAVGQRAASGQPTSSGPQGLARLVGDRMAIEYADIERDVETLAQAAEIIAPEVISLQFRYFDGLSWLAEWDSVSAQRLPNAVEITLGLRRLISEEEQRAKPFDAEVRVAASEVIETRRHVVALPLAEPYTGGL